MAKQDVVVTLKVRVGGEKLRSRKIVGFVDSLDAGEALLDAVQEQVADLAREVQAQVGV